MKRKSRILTGLLCVLLLLSGCAQPAAPTETAGPAETTAAPTENTVPSETAAPTETTAVPTETAAPAEITQTAQPEETQPQELPTLAPYVEETVDSTGDFIDFTLYGRSAVFAELGYLSYDPACFVGKRIRLSGEFLESFDETLGASFYGCVVRDITACCMQGVDFVPAPGFAETVASLENGDTITVEGVFETYTLKGYQLYRLANATVY